MVLIKEMLLSLPAPILFRLSTAALALAMPQVSWAEEAAWFPISEIPELPFDHNEILAFAKEQIKSKIRRQPIGFELLPKYFTLTELQKLYESILETEFDVRNFRKKILSMDFISETGLKQSSVTHRPAKLYKYNAKKYNKLTNSGFAFDL